MSTEVTAIAVLVDGCCEGAIEKRNCFPNFARQNSLKGAGLAKGSIHRRPVIKTPALGYSTWSCLRAGPIALW